jgi:probable addiction module antidote protein
MVTVTNWSDHRLERNRTMPIQLIDYDSADHFKDPDAQAELLRDAIDEGDPGYLAHALGVIARARGMTEIAHETGMKRQALYRALSADGNPKLETIMKVIKALGLRLNIESVPSLAE